MSSLVSMHGSTMQHAKNHHGVMHCGKCGHAMCGRTQHQCVVQVWVCRLCTLRCTSPHHPNCVGAQHNTTTSLTNGTHTKLDVPMSHVSSSKCHMSKLDKWCGTRTQIDAGATMGMSCKDMPKNARACARMQRACAHLWIPRKSEEILSIS